MAYNSRKCGRRQAVRHQLPKLICAGSIPVARSNSSNFKRRHRTAFVRSTSKSKRNENGLVFPVFHPASDVKWDLS